MIITPGPVVDFLISNQNVRDPFSLDWAKVKLIQWPIDNSAWLTVIYNNLIFYLFSWTGQEDIKKSED